MLTRLVADPHMNEIDILCERINSFSNLKSGWDGDDASVPSHQAIRQARVLVRELPHETKLPQVNSSADGEITLTWFRGNKRLNALIDPDLHLVWGTLAGDTFSPGDDLDLHFVSAQPLIEAVVTFYR
jgi:hypothetical protein